MTLSRFAILLAITNLRHKARVSAKSRAGRQIVNVDITPNNAKIEA